MSNPGLIPQIRAALDDLRPAERKVAEAVLADVDFAMRASITELAESAAVSEPSVTRFCRAIGCEGLRDFKMLLAQNVATGLSYASTTIAVDDDIRTLIDKVSHAASEGIAHLRATLDPRTVEAAIGALGAARRIAFFGVGSGSGIVAEDAALRFLRLDIAANAFTDGHLQRLHADLLEPGDVAFAISHAGASVEVNDSIRIARERGATTIGLTTANSPLSTLVDIALLLRLPTTVDPQTPGVSRIAHLCIIDALAIGVALKLGPRTMEKMRHAKARLDHEQQAVRHKSNGH